MSKNWPAILRKAAMDPHSLGNMLLKMGILSEKQLDRALAFQKDHTDIMLGEALVRMKILDRGTLDALLLKQEALRGKSKHAVGQLVELATKRTKETTLEMQGLRASMAAHLLTGE